MPGDRTFILGTRGSELALKQAGIVLDALVSRFGVSVRTKVIRTTGDRVTDRPFQQIEGRGFFTKELEDALLDSRIDLAVHSLKDLPTEQPDGLKIGAVCFREDRREVLIMQKEIREGNNLLPVRPVAVIGTSSVRRLCQIAVHNPHIRIKDLRGNVTT
ncbi:MAG: hydroxymethylbilane synthase, partial [Candidatus Zixiibacteriota bacterium]